jgi:hypothetical protein
MISLGGPRHRRACRKALVGPVEGPEIDELVLVILAGSLVGPLGGPEIGELVLGAIGLRARVGIYAGLEGGEPV